MTQIAFSAADHLILSAYLLATLLLGLRQAAGAARKDAESYILAGRKITLPAFVASLVSTWYGGILGVGEYTYLYGISNWLVFGVPYYLFAILFAVFLAKRARRSGHLTIPDQLAQHYGRPAGVAGAVFIFLISLPAPYVLMLGLLVTLLVPVPLWLAVSAGATFSFLYISRNGLAAVVRTDVLQFGLMFAGFLLLLLFAVFEYGGPGFLIAHLPETHLTWHGGNSLQYIVVWYFVAASTLVDPNFFQRCFAADTARTARAGIFISVGFWFAFDFLTTTTGLYARAALPGLENPVEAFPRLAVILLPDVARGVFFVSLFATVMSTLDSFAFVSAITFGRDIVLRLAVKARRDVERRYIRAGLMVSLAVSVLLAVYTRSVIDLWYQLGSVSTPALAIPLAASFSARWRLRPKVAHTSIWLCGGASLLWLGAGMAGGGPLWGIEPIFPGLALSLGLWAVDVSTRGRW